jgi:hypothetical protein
LSGALAARLEGVEPELRVAADALGAALAGELRRLAPGLTRAGTDEAEPEATLTALRLDREEDPDGLTLAACLAAHRSYVAARGRREAVSAGALALSRLLVWAQRAAMLGPAPRIVWLGPSARRPVPEPGRFPLAAACELEVAGARRRAEAVAVVAGPETPPDRGP